MPDLFTTNFARDTNTLHVSNGERRWRDGTARFGLAAAGRAEVAWGCVFTDFDGDGDEDLVVANGHVYPDAIARELGSARAQDLHFWRRDPERFVRVETAGLCAGARPGVWRGLAAADLDGDGDRDLVLTGLGERAVLLERLVPGGLPPPFRWSGGSYLSSSPPAYESDPDR